METIEEYQERMEERIRFQKQDEYWKKRKEKSCDEIVKILVKNQVSLNDTEDIFKRVIAMFQCCPLTYPEECSYSLDP